MALESKVSLDLFSVCLQQDEFYRVTDGVTCELDMAIHIRVMSLYNNIMFLMN